MDIYAKAIENERAKIALLRAKIAECEKRIVALSAMQHDDDLDRLLTRSLEGASGAPEASTEKPRHEMRIIQSHAPKQESAPSDGAQSKIRPRTRALLAFIGKEGKTLGEIEQYAKSQGWELTRDRIRTFAHNYRTTYGYLSSERPGFVRLTDDGETFVGSMQSETPSVGAEGVSGSTQAAVEADPSSEGLI